LAYLQLGLGIPLLLAGAWLLVRGASALALRLGVPELIIGLTIVAMGTSAPELMVSMLSAFQGATDLAVGNVLGSNISNILLILGVSALISPLAMEKGIRWREIPFTVLATLMLAVLANDRLFGQGENSLLVRGDGLVLLGFFAIYLYYLVSMSLKNKSAEVEEIPSLGVRRASLMVAVGIPALALGGQWIVTGATAVASALGMSEALIGLTILAVGTSLPELATSVMAAMRGSADIAVGNVVGSNVFNLLWILGATAAVKPIAYNPAMNQDLWFLTAVTLVFFLFTFTWKRHKIDRREGALFLVLYAGYLVFIIARG
jgi:cation:H+ antiporter